MASFFAELSLVIVVTFLVSVVVSKLRQPLIIGYLLTGIVVSPIFLDILVEKDGFLTFSHIGISFLLFLVGLQLNLNLVRKVGRASVATGLGQILATVLLAFLISSALGFSPVAALILALGVSFSSTIVIVKLLTDAGDLHKKFGQVSLGFLLVQDLVAAGVLIALSTYLQTGSFSPEKALTTLGLLAAAVLAAFLLIRAGLSGIYRLVRGHDELLFLFTIAWCFGFAGLFDYLGFSLEVGALVSGVLLASYPIHNRINEKIIALRDFFLVIFFMFLGYELMPDIARSGANLATRLSLAAGVFEAVLPVALVLSLIVLIGNPLIVYLTLRLLGNAPPGKLLLRPHRQPGERVLHHHRLARKGCRARRPDRSHHPHHRRPHHHHILHVPVPAQGEALSSAFRNRPLGAEEGSGDAAQGVAVTGLLPSPLAPWMRAHGPGCWLAGRVHPGKCERIFSAVRRGPGTKGRLL